MRVCVCDLQWEYRSSPSELKVRLDVNSRFRNQNWELSVLYEVMAGLTVKSSDAFVLQLVVID